MRLAIHLIPPMDSKDQGQKELTELLTLIIQLCTAAFLFYFWEQETIFGAIKNLPRQAKDFFKRQVFDHGKKLYIYSFFNQNFPPSGSFKQKLHLVFFKVAI
jgi:hypothetical protein